MKYVGTATAARLLGVTPQAVHGLVTRGRLASLYVDGRRLYSEDAIRALQLDPSYQARSRRARRESA